jgi:diguanylate cyclase (GGDEF)-like protein
MRLLSLLAVLLGVVLAPLAVGLAVSDRAHSEDARLRSLTTAAHDEVAALESYFARARSVDLLTAHNPGFVDFYGTGGRDGRGGAHDEALSRSVDALAYLEALYPGSIGEACFIDRGGAENARVVRGTVATKAQLSPDESTHEFFHATFDLPKGRVYQSRPYVSPDTHEWVISNATVVPTPGRAKRAIVHFEVTIESFRRAADALGSTSGVAVLDAATGGVIIDRDRPQRVGAPLGYVDDRFAQIVPKGETGVAHIDGRPVAYARMRRSATNANDWVIVAYSRTPSPSLVGSFGPAPLALLLLAALLVAGGAVSLGVSRRRLTAVANRDALTGLANRRKLDEDLARACASGRGAIFALFDLNGFKPYNDTFGHAAGDALLARLGASLEEAVAGDATTYRLGGDEFCVLAPLDPRTRDTIVARAAAALTDHGDGFTVDASYGAVVVPDEVDAPKDALRLADQRMYAQKQGGRQSVGQQSAAVLLQALTEREPSLGPHVDGVANLARAVALQLGLSPAQVETVEKAARLHDVGKVAIPEAILRKPAPLDAEEWMFIRRHTVIGQRIVSAAPALEEVGELILSSHERWDGTGYPDGLAGTEIPLGARIVAVCDAYDAIVSDRPYASARTHEEAIAELRRSAGTQFDPEVVEAFCAAVATARAAA